MKKRSGRLICLALMVCAGVLLASQVVSAGGQQEAVGGGTLIIGSEFSPPHLNPSLGSGTHITTPATQIFASPLRFDAEWNPQPYVAKSWEFSEDNLSLTLNLREDVTFHDGEPLTSEDVAFSLMVTKANHPFSTMLAPVESVDTPDDHTVVINLSYPHPALLLALSPPLCPILPKHIFGDGQEIRKHPANLNPIGSGPFKFVEYKPGEYLIVEKNENFFIEGRPYLEKIIFQYSGDPGNLIIALENKEFDMFAFVSRTSDILRLEKIDHLEVTSEGFNAIGALLWVEINVREEPLSNKLVRQAIAYALDREFICQELFEGVATPATGPITPYSPFYNPDVERYDLDLDKANALLDQAGYPKGTDGTRFTLTFDFPAAYKAHQIIAEYSKSQLKKVGINVQLRAGPDWSTFSGHVSNWESDLYTLGVFNWGDPIIGVHRTYLTSNIRKGVIFTNNSGYSDPVVEDLMEKAGKETDFEKRKALYNQFQEIIVDDAPIIYINISTFRTAYNKSLKNVNTSIWGSMSPMDQVYWEQPPQR